MRMTIRHPVIAIGGPTASGKSALALDLAVRLGGTVINADSMQVYSDLSILTARPGADEGGRAPHRLYGHVPARERYAADRFRAEALAAIGDSVRHGRVPILVGGTGLYFRAVMQGFSPVPEVPADVRRQAAADLAAAGPDALHRRLVAVDPAIAVRLAPGDRQRIQRAWEVWLATGTPLSDWQALPAAGPPPGVDFHLVRVLPDRDTLYDRCDRRLAWMAARGAWEEVEALAAQRLPCDLPAMKALGVGPFLDALDGRIGRAEALATAQRQTRNYAKRQFTWFRNQWPPPAAGGGVHVCHDHDGQQSDGFLARFQKIIRT